MTKEEGMIYQLAESIMFKLVRHPEKLPTHIEFETEEAAKLFMDNIRKLIGERELPKGMADVIEKMIRQRRGNR